MGITIGLVLFIPLAVALAAAVYFFHTDLDLKWKITALLLVAGSAVLQFVPALHTHFLIPLIIQAFVGIWMFIHMKMG